MSRKWSVRQLLQTLLVINTLAVSLVGIRGSFTLSSVEGQRTTATLRLPGNGPFGDPPSREQTTAPRR